MRTKSSSNSAYTIPYRPDVDGLRAVAVLGVVAYHAFPFWIKGGFVGVDVFFVISGYLISRIILSRAAERRFSLLGFYKRRIRRIFPALVVVLAFAAAVGAVLLGPDEYKELGAGIAAGAGFTSNLLLWAQTGYFDTAAETKPLLHLWSLGIEEQFYMFWPLLLIIGLRLGYLRSMIVLLGLMSLSTGIVLTASDPAAGFYAPYARFWELMAGAFLAASLSFETSSKPGLPRQMLAAGGLLLILISMFWFTSGDSFPGWRALLPVTGAFLLIASGPAAFINRTLLANPVAQFVGLISYPLYLWHWPILSFLQIFDGEPLTRYERIWVVIVCFLLAVLTYWLIEKPIRFGPHLRLKFAALATAMVCIGFFGISDRVLGGFPDRFGANQALMQRLDSDAFISDWRNEVRTNSCHLQHLGLSQHDPACIETARPLVMLWGDSHAAALALGLRGLQKEKAFGLAQFTQASCPPLFKIDGRTTRPNCESINRALLDEAARLKPDIILLDSAWQHRDFSFSAEETAPLIIDAVARIRAAAPQASIFVIGPVPRWNAPLPAIYRRALVLHQPLPDRMSGTFLDTSIFLLDDTLKGKLHQANLAYISIVDTLCAAAVKEYSCLSRLGVDGIGLAYIDAEHLSEEASTFVVNKIAPLIFSEKLRFAAMP